MKRGKGQKRVLITAGPTQEPIDDVRYITNSSSGKMGIALAREALRRGYDVTMVHGPISQKIPRGCHSIAIRTSKDMIREVSKELQRGYDILIGSAAMADFYVEKISGKLDSKKPALLHLEPGPKLLEIVCKRWPQLFIVGFKAEYKAKNLVKIASKFMEEKGLDMVVANDLSQGVFASDETDIIILDRSRDLSNGKGTGRISKAEASAIIWNRIEKLWKEQSRGVS